MFLGHLAVGFAAKKLAPKASLGTLFVAAQFLDLLWPAFILIGLEKVQIVPGITPVTPLDFIFYPFSHSLIAALGWSLLIGGAYFLIRRQPRESLVIGLAVLSHWVLDFASHRPDLPLGIHSEFKVGLGLWFFRSATVAVELTLLIIGCAVYARATQSKNKAGRFGFWILIGFLCVSYFAAVFGPPPPSVTAIGWAGQSMWLLVLWGYWLDRQRPLAVRIR